MAAFMGPMGNSQLSSENKSVHISSQDTNVHPPTHSFSKLISSFLSTMHLRLLHFWVFPLLPGLFVQVVLDGKHAVYSNLQIKKKNTAGSPWGSHWKIHYSGTLSMPNSSAFKVDHAHSDILGFKILSVLFTLTLPLLRILLGTTSGALRQSLAASWCGNGVFPLE